MAERTIAQKLLVKPGDTVRVSGATDAERALIGDLPDGATFTEADDSADAPAIEIVFVRSRDELLAGFGADLPALAGARAVWYCYPKGGRADLNRDTIMRETGAFGWRPISNIAIDPTWSAVRVRPLAPGEAPVG